MERVKFVVIYLLKQMSGLMKIITSPVYHHQRSEGLSNVLSLFSFKSRQLIFGLQLHFYAGYCLLGQWFFFCFVLTLNLY